MPNMGASAETAPQACGPLETGGALWVTAQCLDPQYNRPVIDSQIDLTVPVPIHKVSGHFEGTDKKFNFYFPAKSKWKGRFFQLVYPLQDENATEDTISFGADSGAYTVQTNGGSGYRADAAAAKFSKIVAADYYGSSKRIYGYVYGGSGGSYMTIGAIENTSGVWDGAVPFIPGAPTSIPNNFFARAFARFVLGDKASQIADQVSPGGGGNAYAGLNEAERAVLDEVTKLGVPLRALEDYPYALGLTFDDGLLGFASAVKGIDPTYVDDFWSKPGYLGTEQSALGKLFQDAKIDQYAAVAGVSRNAQNEPISLTLGSAPANPSKLPLDFTLYAADGTTKLGALSGTLDPAAKLFALGSGNASDALNAIHAGAKLRIDNRWSLALLSYHRHQIPKQTGFYAWDPFKAADGSPLYPQRPLEIGPLITGSVTGGAKFDGMIHTKVIMVANVLDADAYPWQADWYSKQVKNSLGKSYDNHFRLWYNDNADHIGPRTARLIDYNGILQQALRDVSAWAEKGVAPAGSTRYQVTNGQVLLPAGAAVRQGIQPVVDLTVGGAARIDIAAGKSVTFKAKIQVPPGSGKIVRTDWDFLGDGRFSAKSFGAPKPTVEVSVTYTFTKPGTYFPALRATSQREGNASTPFANVQNLGRVRVVVH
nr:PKD domain-containing protein [Cohnella sp. OV330]